MPGGCIIYEVRPDCCRRFPFLSAVALTAYEKDNTIIVPSYCQAATVAVSAYRNQVERLTGLRMTETKSSPIDRPARSIEEELENMRAAQREARHEKQDRKDH